MMLDERSGPAVTPSYGRCFGSLLIGLSPFFMLMTMSALFGADTVMFNGGNVHGVGAIVVSMLIGIVFAAILAGLQKLGYLVLDFVLRARGRG